MMLWPAIDPGPATFWDRTLGYQAGRDSPFSIWGQVHGLEPLRVALLVAVAALSIALAFRPRRKSLVQVAALGAALIIALQLTATHWFYLYIVWFFPLLIVALHPDRWGRGRGRDSPRRAGIITCSIESASPLVDLDHGAHHPDVVLGGFEADRHLRDQRLERLLAA